MVPDDQIFKFSQGAMVTKRLCVIEVRSTGFFRSGKVETGRKEITTQSAKIVLSGIQWAYESSTSQLYDIESQHLQVNRPGQFTCLVPTPFVLPAHIQSHPYQS